MARRTTMAKQAPHWIQRFRWWLTGAGFVAAAAMLTWVLWPEPTARQPRERQYLEFTACLLTGERGITAPDTAPVWAGMQDASVTTHAKVQYLAVAGPQTTENALPFLNSLAQSRCEVIIGVGVAQIAATEVAAQGYPSIHFYVVGGTSTAANLSSIKETDSTAVRAEVSRIIQEAVKSGRPT